MLSRHLDINVHDAKKLLYSFYKKHEDLVEATYLISGTLDGNNDLKIKVTKDINEREKFDKIQSIQIYSLSPQNIEINEIIATANAQIQEYAVDESKLSKWGLIKGPELIKIDPIAKQEKTQSQASVNSRKPEPKNAPSSASKKKEFPDMGLRSAQILNRNKKKEDEAKPKARTATQPTFGSTSNKQSKAKPERSKTEPAKESKSEVEQAKSKADTKKDVAAKAEKDKKQKELESMFDDDDDDDILMEERSVKKDDEDVETTEKVSKKDEDLEGIFDSSFSQTQSQPNKEEVEPTPKDDEPEVVEDAKPEEEQKEEEREEEKDEVTSFYDEDGYLVTKVTEKPKAKPKPKPKARPSPTPSAPAKRSKTTGSSSGSKQQSSLMSFFGKK